jgi:hypothetical protein
MVANCGGGVRRRYLGSGGVVEPVKVRASGRLSCWVPPLLLMLLLLILERRLMTGEGVSAGVSVPQYSCRFSWTLFRESEARWQDADDRYATTQPCLRRDYAKFCSSSTASLQGNGTPSSRPP